MNTTNHTDSANGTSTRAKLLWKHPDPTSTPMSKYLQHVNYTYNLRLSTYPELHRWSIDHIDTFWESVWKFVGVRAEGSESPVSSSQHLTVRYH